MMTLYHYVHCPYCVRVRMALGFLQLEFKSIVLPYDDEKTPVDLCQKKMLPIMIFEDGSASNESLEIIKALDGQNLLSHQFLEDAELKSFWEEKLNQLGSPIHSLAMPYWIWTPEFSQKSREYFIRKKEVKRGPFNKLAQDKQKYLDQLLPQLNQLEQELTPFIKEKFSILDIMLASHLWGLFIVPEFQFSPQLYHYLQEIKARTQFEYHEDFWQGSL